MSPMTLKHTKSPTGRTHRLTDPKSGQCVTKHYVETPRFDDQVQGDLIREFSRTIFPVVIGILPTSIDPMLRDKGQKAPNLDYLRGYLAGLTAKEMGAQRTHVIKSTREQIARLEAQIGVTPQAPAYGGPVHEGGIPRDSNPLTRPGGGNVQVNIVQLDGGRIPGLAEAEHQRRMREQGR